MSGAYYNENDPFCVEWLRRLIVVGMIAPGDVDDRSILDVHPEDLRGYDQHHFFAGIGVWSYALRQAGWADDRAVWTGSCPCQPFSAAGKGSGFADERHLWPAWFWLIDQLRPDTILGEQVAAKPGLAWFDLVSSDLEAAGYTVGAADLCAAGVGAPHIRQRLWWLAHHHHEGQRQRQERDGWEIRRSDRQASCGSHVNGCGVLVEPESQQARVSRRTRQSGEPLAHHHPRLEIVGEQPSRSQRATAERSGEAGALQHPEGDGQIERRTESSRRSTPGFWRETDWIPCRDGKWRPVEPGTFPLVDRAPSRVGRLRGYGNAIVAPLATAFIETVIDILDEHRLTS